MSNYTAGPWSRTGYYVYSDEQRKVIADCRKDNGEGLLRVKTEAEAVANMKLIAASPELLKALEEFAVDQVMCDSRLPSDMRKNLECMYYTVILPLLAKAKGKS